LLALLLATFVLSSSFYSEIHWNEKAQSDRTNSIRSIVGFPSIAVGALSIAQRNPLIEMYCTSFYDAPGSHCGYYTTGVAWYNMTWWRVDD
jgi:hypothetical protein